jgi:uncharacterized protein (DUF2147 family)
VQTPAPVRCADWLRRAARAASLAIALTSFAVPGTAASAMAPNGAWFIDGTGGAVQIFDCNGLLCGRIIWLWTARDIAGRPASDKKNPDPASRQRLLCGLTILQGLQPAGLDHWNSGSLYNPDDGVTYRVSQSSVRLMCLSRAYISACRSLVRPRPCCVFRGSGRKDGVSATGAGGAALQSVWPGLSR